MIQLENVVKRLGGKIILDGVSLHVERGESLVLVGSSGTGKSVTLKHIVGLMQADSGSITVDGVDISTVSGAEASRLRRKFGMLFQSGALINWMSVFENIALPLYEHTRLNDAEIAEQVRQKLDLVNLPGCEQKKPGEISGGMKKRVGLARAIIGEPEILLYDEPTSGLDPVMSRHIDRLILSLQEKLGVTSVVVTHDLHSAFSVADRIAMLHEGTIIAHCTPEEFVKNDHPSVQEFVKAQFETGKVKGGIL